MPEEDFDDGRVRSLVARVATGCDVAVLEGVMGYYDGIMGAGTRASSYDVARATQTPVVLVVNSRGASLSLAATVGGFAGFRADANVRGFILNQCTHPTYEAMAPVIERECGVRALGFVPKDKRFALESRHLGLVGADEVADLTERIDALAATLAETLDVGGLLALAAEAPDLAAEPFSCVPVCTTSPRIAVARDEAFSFYYEENLRLLADLGAEVVEFSPLADGSLPAGACGLYLGGGYPEIHTRRLYENDPMVA